LWKFHELDMQQLDFDKMIANDFRGLLIVNPMNVSLLTKPTKQEKGVDIYLVDLVEWVKTYIDSDIIMVGKLANAT